MPVYSCSSTVNFVEERKVQDIVLVAGFHSDRFRGHVGLTATVWRFPDTGTPFVVNLVVPLCCFRLRYNLGIAG